MQKQKVKVYLGIEAKLLILQSTYADMTKKVCSSFGSKLPSKYSLFYYDSDEELITIDTEDDYETFITSEQKSFKLFVGENGEEVGKWASKHKASEILVKQKAENSSINKSPSNKVPLL